VVRREQKANGSDRNSASVSRMCWSRRRDETVLKGYRVNCAGPRCGGQPNGMPLVNLTACLAR
jgi:hypothetical protein